MAESFLQYSPSRTVLFSKLGVCNGEFRFLGDEHVQKLELFSYYSHGCAERLHCSVF